MKIAKFRIGSAISNSFLFSRLTLERSQISFAANIPFSDLCFLLSLPSADHRGGVCGEENDCGQKIRHSWNMGEPIPILA